MLFTIKTLHNFRVYRYLELKRYTIAGGQWPGYGI